MIDKAILDTAITYIKNHYNVISEEIGNIQYDDDIVIINRATNYIYNSICYRTTKTVKDLYRANDIEKIEMLKTFYPIVHKSSIVLLQLNDNSIAKIKRKLKVRDERSWYRITISSNPNFLYFSDKQESVNLNGTVLYFELVILKIPFLD